MKDCNVCGRPVTSRGKYCSEECLLSWREATKKRKLRARFEEKVDKLGPTIVPALGRCHIWTGMKNDRGYGMLRVGGRDGRAEKAHRVAFFLANGRWPEPYALHRCDNRACVRIEHLFEGTQTDNMADMRAKGRAAPMPDRWALTRSRLDPLEDCDRFEHPTDPPVDTKTPAECGQISTTTEAVESGEAFK